jgi:hypothetical protein
MGCAVTDQGAREHSRPPQRPRVAMDELLQAQRDRLRALPADERKIVVSGPAAAQLRAMARSSR